MPSEPRHLQDLPGNAKIALDMADRFLSTRATADRLGLSVDRVRQLIRSGDLRAHRLGERGDYRILVSDADAVMVPVRAALEGADDA